MRKNIFFILISITIYFHSYGQEWRSGDTKKSFHQIQKEFNEYWKDKEPTKGSGYKQFKRWEHHWSTRLMPDGNFPPAGKNMNEYQSFMRTQKNAGNRSLSGSWIAKGPFNSEGGVYGMGRVNCIAFHPTNTQIIYVGSAGGGLWKSVDGGTTWNPKTDNLNGSIGISAILVHPVNPEIIYIATGDGNNGDNYSTGVLKSTNGGGSFSMTGLNWTTATNKLIRKMVFDSDDLNTILVAANDGVYRSTDGGTNWTVQISNENVFDIETAGPSHPNVFVFSSNDKIYKSIDNGVNWLENLHIPNSGRIALTTDYSGKYYAISAKNTNGQFNGFYKSEDFGNTFQIINVTPINILSYFYNGNQAYSQGLYDLCITINPNNSNIIYVGGINLWKSYDGGTNWEIVNFYPASSAGENTNNTPVVHADKHALEWQGNVLWEGNDGGIYKTSDAGQTWEDKTNNLQISQIHRIGISQINSRIVSGLQDNGCKLFNNSWSNNYTGDGGEVFFKLNSGSTFYHEGNNGKDLTKRYINSFGVPLQFDINPPLFSGRGAWITPFLHDPNEENTIYVGYKKVYKLTGSDLLWNQIGDFTNDSLFFLSIAPSNSNFIYAATHKSIWKTDNGGGMWSSILTPFISINTFISRIIVHPNNPNIVYITLQNYESSNKVYKSINGGVSWENISYNLPNIPFNCIAFENGSNEGLYLGSDVGVFYKNASNCEWLPFNEGLPKVEITDIEIDYGENSVYVATYGRGVWASDLYTGSSILDIDECTVTSQSLTVSTSCNPQIFSTCGATFSGFSSCIGDQDDDVFFSFTTSASTTTVQITVTSLDQFDAVFQVMSGPCGQNMQELNGTCINNTGAGGEESSTITGLLPNTQYYIRLWGFGNGTTPNSHEFEICVVKCEQPDFIVIEPTISPMTSSSNQTIDFSCKVVNRGFTSASPDILKFYLSVDAMLTENQNGDIFLDSYDITQSLPSDDTINLSNISITLPSSIPNGMYFLYFWVDANNSIEECDEMNNFASTFLTISTPISTTQPAYRFWFDNNFSQSLVTNTTNAPNNLYDIQHNILTNTLRDGLHTLNFQFKDENNDWSSCVSSFFYKTNDKFPSGSPRYQYWFDNNFTQQVTNQITSSNNLILNNIFNSTNINPGLHTFNIRFKPDGKHWSSINSSFFYKPKEFPTGSPRYEYWVDQDYSDKVSVNNSSTPDFILLSNLDMNDVPAGLHTFNIRFRPQGKAWTGINSSFFYKTTPEMAGQPYYQYWFDNNITDSVTVNIAPMNNLILNSSFNTDNLAAGLHTFNIRFRSDGKKSSIINSSFFYKVPPELQGQPKYQYWFDNNIQDSITINTASTTNFILLEQINSMQLPEGLHTFNIRFKPTGGKWSVINTSFFVRGRSVNPTEITKCLYWFDEDFNNQNTVLYSGSSNIFDIIYTNTPNLSNGEHTISMFFMDNAGYWSSIVKDTFVKDTILPIQCPNNQIFTSGLGNQYILSYQWQVNDGTGYTNISNTSVYNGTNADTLILSNAPSSWYGYLYRCIVTTNQGPLQSAPVPLRFVYYWDGSVDNNWETAGNWNCNIVPGLNADVIINSGNVQVNSNVTISSLTLGSTAEYSVLSNNIFTLTGH